MGVNCSRYGNLGSFICGRCNTEYHACDCDFPLSPLSIFTNGETYVLIPLNITQEQRNVDFYNNILQKAQNKENVTLIDPQNTKKH